MCPYATRTYTEKCTALCLSKRLTMLRKATMHNSLEFQSSSSSKDYWDEGGEKGTFIMYTFVLRFYDEYGERDLFAYGCEAEIVTMLRLSLFLCLYSSSTCWSTGGLCWEVAVVIVIIIVIVVVMVVAGAQNKKKKVKRKKAR